MKKNSWKYLWSWNEPYIIFGGIGPIPFKKMIRKLKKEKVKYKSKICSSMFDGHTLLMIFCKTEKTKRIIQKNLLEFNYIDDINDVYGWTKDEDIIFNSLKY